MQIPAVQKPGAARLANGLLRNPRQGERARGTATGQECQMQHLAFEMRFFAVQEFCTDKLAWLGQGHVLQTCQGCRMQNAEAEEEQQQEETRGETEGEEGEQAYAG